MRIVYVNGDYVSEDQARISIFDRGFLFGDGIYEVNAVLDGRLVDFDNHFARLQRSLREMKMDFRVDREDLLDMHRELVSRNQIDEGVVYMQITRGAADRAFTFPPADTPPTLVAFTQVHEMAEDPRAAHGLKVISLPDQRWGRCDIKSVQLVSASLAKVEAQAQGVDDAWLVRDGMVTEGTSNNAYIVTEDDVIVTRELSSAILPGVTRNALLAAANRLGMRVEERAFSLEEAYQAKEAFITSATTFVMPVVEVDGQRIGGGQPGPAARTLRDAYLEEARRTAI